MGVTYAPAFDLDAIRDGDTATDYAFSMTITGSGVGAGTAITITSADFVTAAASSTVVHSTSQGFTAVTNHDGVSMFTDHAAASFASALSTAIETERLANGWANGFSVSFADDRITIARSGGAWTFTITWTNLAGRRVCGFEADQTTPATSTFTSTQTPTYWINATQDGRSLDREGNYEADGIAALAISASATQSAGTSRGTAPKFRSWFQHFEIKRKVFKASANGTDLWTFEHLWEHCRCELPFMVNDGVEVMACVFTAEGAVFANKQRSGGPSDDIHFNVPFTVWLAGTITGGG